MRLLHKVEMTELRPVHAWNPMDYLTSEELARLDERFDSALRDAKILVFWTGLSLELAQRWADQRGLQTLIIRKVLKGVVQVYEGGFWSVCGICLSRQPTSNDSD